MKKSEIKTGAIYDIEDRRLHWGAFKAEVLGPDGSGGWKVKLLDPPYAGHQRTVTSRQITRHWLPQYTRVRHRDTRVAGGPEKQKHYDDLAEVACQLAEEIESLDPTHSVGISNIALPSGLAPSGAPGQVSLSLPEPAARALLSALQDYSSSPGALEEII